MPVRVTWGWPLTSTSVCVCEPGPLHTHKCWCTNVQNLRPYAVGCNHITFTGSKKLEFTVLCHSVGALKDSGLYQASGLTPLCTTFTSYKTAVEERKPLPVPLRVLCIRGWGITGIFAILQYFFQCQGYRLLQEADMLLLETLMGS